MNKMLYKPMVYISMISYINISIWYENNNIINWSPKIRITSLKMLPKRIGKRITLIINDMISRSSKIDDLGNRSFLSEDVKILYSSFVKERLDRLSK